MDVASIECAYAIKALRNGQWVTEAEFSDESNAVALDQATRYLTWLQRMNPSNWYVITLARE